MRPWFLFVVVFSYFRESQSFLSPHRLHVFANKGFRRRSYTVGTDTTSKIALRDSIPNQNATENNLKATQLLDSARIGSQDKVTINERPKEGSSKRWFQFWRRRHVPTENQRDEGSSRLKLSLLLSRIVEPPKERRYGARAITGLIKALAEEANDLDVQVVTQANSPFWRKDIDRISIEFSRLAFKPFRLVAQADVTTPPKRDSFWHFWEQGNASRSIMTLDETFDILDADNSGALDRQEVAAGLGDVAGDLPSASASTRIRRRGVLQDFSSELFTVYDTNNDDVVDRDECRSLVQDMISLRLEEAKETEKVPFQQAASSFKLLADSFISVLGLTSDENQSVDHALQGESLEPLSGTRALGSVSLSNLRVDMRRLVFGEIPIVKDIVPGGPLVLDPFLVNATGAVASGDIMNSSLVNSGFRELVAVAFRKRLKSLQGVLEQIIGYGRPLGEKGPVVQVTNLTSVDFDNQDRMLIAGQLQARKLPFVQAINIGFMVRTRIGTEQNGHVVCLVKPELGIPLQCPKVLEQGIAAAFKRFNISPPDRLAPIILFLPVPSFEDDDNDLLDLGEDTCVDSISIENGLLNFEAGTALRPGKFLGSHYIAFIVPVRTFIVTLDRARTGIRIVRQAKKAEMEESDGEIDIPVDIPPPRSLFTRFLDGYLQTEKETADKKQMAAAIRDFFGTQRVKMKPE